MEENYEYFIMLCAKNREWRAIEYWFNRLGLYLEEQEKCNA